MHNPRTYGYPPYSTVVVHGGPGAAGETAPVARELSRTTGILEPLQTAHTINGQVAELASLISTHGHPPATLIGYSWGAWLGWITAARHPGLVRRLVLVSAGPFENRYVSGLHDTRMSRLDDGERRRFERAVEMLRSSMQSDAASGEAAPFRELAALSRKADGFDIIPDAEAGPEEVDVDVDIFRSIWPEAAEMRRNGALLEYGRRINCPVAAIHGDHDPHPAAGVETPLRAVLTDFRFLLLGKCGHTPWIERHARAEFLPILREMIEQDGGAD